MQRVLNFTVASQSTPWNDEGLLEKSSRVTVGNRIQKWFHQSSKISVWANICERHSICCNSYFSC